MATKKMKLEEAKKILETEKIFYNGNKKFNLIDAGKYNSGITIEIPQEWTLDKYRRPENPINYINAKDLTDGMGLDFDGEATVLFGKYRLSKNNRPVFELTEPTDSKDVLIKVSWGGAFNTTAGSRDEYAKESNATFFTKRSSNGRGVGNDYWILPVDYVSGIESRDVSQILKNIQEKKDVRNAEISEYLAKEDAEIKSSIECRDDILPQIQLIFDEIKNYNPEFAYEILEDQIKYNYSGSSFGSVSQRYSKELVNELNNLLSKAKEEKEKQDSFATKLEDLKDIFEFLNLECRVSRTEFSLNSKNKYDFSKSYSYSEDAYNSMINDIKIHKEKIEEDREKTRLETENLRKAAELSKKKLIAQNMGYPKKFEFFNRQVGVINQSHAYVIESNGEIRNPDYNNLINGNHKHIKDWINVADGDQGYDQILPGEVIVTYTKMNSSTPYEFDVEWVDDELTEQQIAVVCEVLKDKSNYATDINDREIKNVENWIKSAAKKKLVECKKQLKCDKTEKSYASEIVDLAEKKNNLQEKNKKANNLVESYEEAYQNGTKKNGVGED